MTNYSHIVLQQNIFNIGDILNHYAKKEFVDPRTHLFQVEFFDFKNCKLYLKYYCLVMR